MIRAIFFDFYGVWTPDLFSEYLAEAERHGPEAVTELRAVVEQYFRGQAGPQEVAQAFRYRLGRPDIDSRQFTLREQDIYPAIVEFMRGLHGHFLKVGVLANLGPQEYKMLSSFNQHDQVFEAIAGPLPFKLDAPLLSQDVFAQALQAIGEPPPSCLVVSGSNEYLSFAQGLGMTTLAYEGFPKLQQYLNDLLASEAA